jgi:hypothetical protein
MKSLQNKIVAIPFVGLLMLAQAVSAGELTNISDFGECRTIEDKAERLLCYDTVADGKVFNEQQLQQVKKENFGSKKKPNEVAPVEQLAVTVVNVKKSSTGIHYFYTADGAVWKQSTGARWNLKAPFEAQIKAGKLGSFFLLSDSGKSTRVKRVR